MRSKILRSLKNSNGFGIMEVMVAAGISTVIGMAMLTMSKNMINAAAGVKNAQEVNEATSSVVTVISNTKLCAGAFRDAGGDIVEFPGTGDDRSVVVSSIRFGPDAPPFMAPILLENGTKVGGNQGGMQVTGMTLALTGPKISDIYRSAGVMDHLHPARLTVNFSKIANSSALGATAAKEKTFDLTVILSTTGNNPMTGCVGTDSVESFCILALGGSYDAAASPQCSLRKLPMAVDHPTRNTGTNPANSYIDGVHIEANGVAPVSSPLSIQSRIATDTFRWVFDGTGVATFLSNEYLAGSPPVIGAEATTLGIDSGTAGTTEPSDTQGLILQGGVLAVLGSPLGTRPLVLFQSPATNGGGTYNFGRNGDFSITNPTGTSIVDVDRLNARADLVTGGNISTTNGSFLTTNGNITTTNGTVSGRNVNVGAMLNAVNITAGELIKAKNVEASVKVSVTSDARKKEQIKTIDHGLEKILSLRGVSFRWREDKRVDIGVIAQEVQKVFPALVDKTSDGFLAVNYLGLIGPIIEAIREVDNKCTASNAERAKLEAAMAKREAAMDKRIRELEKKLETLAASAKAKK